MHKTSISWKKKYIEFIWKSQIEFWKHSIVKFKQVSTGSDMFENRMNCNNSYLIESEQV